MIFEVQGEGVSNHQLQLAENLAGLGDEAYFDKENDNQYILHYSFVVR